MAAVESDQRREAERVPVEADGWFGESHVRVVELSLVGSRIIHLDRIVLDSAAVLRVPIAGVDVRAAARVTRSEFVFRGGAKFYESGLQFCASMRGAPPDVERALGAILGRRAPVSHPEPRGGDGKFVMCVRSPNLWRVMPTDDARQPRDGFTMLLPADENEIDAYCRTYDMADAETRRIMRLAFELKIAESLRAGDSVTRCDS